MTITMNKTRKTLLVLSLAIAGATVAGCNNDPGVDDGAIDDSPSSAERVAAITAPAQSSVRQLVIGGPLGTEDFGFIFARGSDLVAPAVGWLAHETCSVSGEMFVAIAGRVARAFVAETPGVYQPSWSIEDVAANIDAIQKSNRMLEDFEKTIGTDIFD